MARHVARWWDPGSIHVSRLRAYGKVVRLPARALAPVRAAMRRRQPPNVYTGGQIRELSGFRRSAPCLARALPVDGRFRPARGQLPVPGATCGHKPRQRSRVGITKTWHGPRVEVANDDEAGTQGATQLSVAPVRRVTAQSGTNIRRGTVRPPSYRGGLGPVPKGALAPSTGLGQQVPGEVVPLPVPDVARPAFDTPTPVGRRLSTADDRPNLYSGRGKQTTTSTSGRSYGGVDDFHSASGVTTIHIDGNALGRWTIEHLTRALARPSAGTTSIDPRSVVPRSRVAPF